MDHRQKELIGLRVHALLHPAPGGSGQITTDATQGWQGVPSQDYRPHQMWATDASYFKVIGWGYSYMVMVMDDYSRFIPAHKIQRDMTADSFI